MTQCRSAQRACEPNAPTIDDAMQIVRENTTSTIVKIAKSA